MLVSPPSADTIESNALCRSLSALSDTVELDDELEELDELDDDSALTSESRSVFIGLSESEVELEDSPMLCRVFISVYMNSATAS